MISGLDINYLSDPDPDDNYYSENSKQCTNHMVDNCHDSGLKFLFDPVGNKTFKKVGS